MSAATKAPATEIIDTYLASLTEPNTARRAALMEKAWTPDARYVDPHHDLEPVDRAERQPAAVGRRELPGPVARHLLALDRLHRPGQRRQVGRVPGLMPRQPGAADRRRAHPGQHQHEPDRQQ